MKFKRPLTTHPEELSFKQIMGVLTRLGSAGIIDAPGFGASIQYPPEAQFRVMTLISWGATLADVDRAIREEDERIETGADIPEIFEEAFRMTARLSAQMELKKIDAERSKITLSEEARVAALEERQSLAERRLARAEANPDRAAAGLVVDLSKRLRGPVWSNRQEQAMGVLYGPEFLKALAELGRPITRMVREESGLNAGYIYAVSLLERGMGVPMSMETLSKLDQPERDALREDPTYAVAGAALPRQDIVAQLDKVYGSINGHALESDDGPSPEEEWKRRIHDDPEDRTHLAIQGILRRRSRMFARG